MPHKAPSRPQKHPKTPQCATLFKKPKQSAPLRGAFWRIGQYNPIAAKPEKSPPKTPKTAHSRHEIFP
jgi:hypothetical protein